MRVSELAKALELSSKELLVKLKTLRIAAKSASSILDADAVNRARKALAKPKKPAPTAKPAVRTALAATLKKPAAIATAPSAKTAAKAATAVAGPPKPSAPPHPAAARAPAAPPAAEPAGPSRRLELTFPISVKDLAARMDVKASDVIKHLLQQKIFASIVQLLDEATAVKAAAAFNVEIVPAPTLEEQLLKSVEPDPKRMAPRAPVVTLMGHVGHGKTSLRSEERRVGEEC